VAGAAQVTLAWDSNNPTPDGYRVYSRVEGRTYNYSSPAWTGATTTATIANLADNTTYYCVVRAYVGSEESGNSNEVKISPQTSSTSSSTSDTTNSSDSTSSSSTSSNITDSTTADSGTTSNNSAVIVLDDGDTGTIASGNWLVSSRTNAYGSQSLYSKDTNGHYTFASELSGRYEVSIWWTDYYSRCASVPIYIYDDNVLLKTFYLDQRTNGGLWNILGSFQFSGMARVVVASRDSNCSTCADAVEFSFDPDDDGMLEEDEIIIDNTDPAFSTGPKPWSSSKFSPGGYNTTYQYAPPGDGTGWASWIFNPERSGDYTIYAHWTEADNRSKTAPYTIINNGTEISVTVDQTIDGGKFVSLGTYWIDAGPVEVVLNDAIDGYVVADAVKLTYRGSGVANPATEDNTDPDFSTMTVDNTDPDFSTLGAWSSSSFTPGYAGSDYHFASPGSGGKAATWQFSIPEAGLYDIRAQWSAYSNRSPGAAYTIVNNGVTLGIETADQTVDGGQLNSLGAHYLQPGSLEVVLKDNPDGYVVADIVQVVRE